MSSKTSLSGNHLTIAQIDNHYEEVRAALREYFSPRSSTFNARFFGYTPEEVRLKWRARLAEHDQACSLILLGSVEALFRIDYTRRVQLRKKDDLSRAFRGLSSEKGPRVSLEKDIWAAWVKHKEVLGIQPQLVSDLKAAFKYRHWLAHGRYWTPKLGREYDYASLSFLAKRVLDTFPLVLD